MSYSETKAISWIELAIIAKASEVEQWESWLLSIGAEVVTLCDAANQPIYELMPGETPWWDHTEIKGLFPATVQDKTLAAQLESYCSSAALMPVYTIHRIADEDWSQEWLKYVKPIHIQSHFWVVAPALQSQITDPKAQILLLEPGLAFGTGSHPTTQLCLQALFQYQDYFHHKAVIDYGCGSGILGLTALKLGANRILAIDISEQALAATQQNAYLNNFDSKSIHVMLPENLILQPCSNLLVANILANPLIELATQFQQLLKPGGVLILSGLLEVDKSRVIAAYTPNFRLVNEYQAEEWLCLVFKL